MGINWMRAAAIALCIALLACGGGDGDAQSDTTGEAADEASSEQAEATPDSIPMEITVTVSGGQSEKMGGAGTYTAKGKGAGCVHDPAAQPGKTMAEWSVYWGSETAPVQSVVMQIGKTGPDNTSREMTMQLMAGQVEAMGMKAPQMLMIGTFPTGAISGRGVARVQRQGDGVRIEVDAEPAQLGSQVKMVVVCEKLGRV